MSKNIVQASTFYLAGSGVIVGATSVVLTSFTDIYGNALSMADFGDTGYGTLEPDTTNEEAFTFTSVTTNANGTVTLGGVSTTLAKSPYTATSGLVRAHAGGTKMVITDTAAFWNTFANTANQNTFADVQTFNVPSVQATDPTSSTQVANKHYVDVTAVAGAPNASTTVKGIIELATQAETDARTATGGTGASLVIPTTTVRSTLHSDYAADTGSANAYAIAPSPAITAYTVGQQLSFKATNTNTTTSTLNVNSLGTKTIKRPTGSDLVANDIVSGQIVSVEYDGTNFQMISPSSNTLTSTANITSTSYTFTAAEAITQGAPVAAGYYQSDGGVKLDTKTTSNGSGTSVSFGITVANNPNRIVVVFLSALGTISNVQLDGVAMTAIDTVGVQGSLGGAGAWYTIAPSAAAHTVTATIGSAVSWTAAAYSYYNVNQSTPIDAHNVNGDASGSNKARTITPGSIGCLAMGWIGTGANGGSSSYTTTSVPNNQSAPTNGFSSLLVGDNGHATSTASQSFTFTGTGGSNPGAGYGALTLKPATTASLDYVVNANSANAVSYTTPTSTAFRSQAFIGFAVSTVSTGQSLVVTTGGIATGLSGLTPLAQYYLNDTNGTIGTSPGTNSRKVGIAVDTTNIAVTNI